MLTAITDREVEMQRCLYFINACGGANTLLYLAQNHLVNRSSVLLRKRVCAKRGEFALVSKTDIISQVRELAHELGSLCADHNLVRLETLLWATEQQAVLETLIEAAGLPEGDEAGDLQAPERAA